MDSETKRAPSGKGGKKGGRGANSSRTGSANIYMECVMKYLAPEVMAAAIIGKGGAAIAELRKSHGAELSLTDKGAVYPQTDCRVLTVQAEKEESLNQLSKQLVAKLAELAKESSATDAIGYEGELKVRVVVPRAAVGGVIGKGGEHIKEVQKTCGAKISIGEPAGTGPGASQVVSLAGPPEALEYVLSEVNNQIQMLNKEPWFQPWAAATGIAPAASPYGGQLLPSWGPTPPASSSPGIDLMIRVAQSMPSYVMEDSRGFALSCVVPNRIVGGLIGRGGSGTREVISATGAQVGIREVQGDPDNQKLNITGPLSNTCAAYMLMMKRYLDAERPPSRGAGQ